MGSDRLAFDSTFSGRVPAKLQESLAAVRSGSLVLGWVYDQPSASLEWRMATFIATQTCSTRAKNESVQNRLVRGVLAYDPGTIPSVISTSWEVVAVGSVIVITTKDAAHQPFHACITWRRAKLTRPWASSLSKSMRKRSSTRA